MQRYVCLAVIYVDSHSRTFYILKVPNSHQYLVLVVLIRFEELYFFTKAHQFYVHTFDYFIQPGFMEILTLKLLMVKSSPLMVMVNML